MPEINDAQLLTLVRSRFGLSETVVDEVRAASEHDDRSVEEVLIEMGVVSRGALDSLIGVMPTEGAFGDNLEGEYGADNLPDLPTDGGRIEGKPLTANRLAVSSQHSAVAKVEAMKTA